MKKRLNTGKTKQNQNKTQEEQNLSPNKRNSPPKTQPKPRKFYANSVLEARKKRKEQEEAENEGIEDQYDETSSFTPKPEKIKINGNQNVSDSISEEKISNSQKIFTPQIHSHKLVSYLTTKNRLLSPQQYKYDQQMRKQKKLQKRKEMQDNAYDEYKANSFATYGNVPSRNYTTMSQRQNTKQNSMRYPNSIQYPNQAQIFPTSSESQSQEEPVIILKKTVNVTTKSDAENVKIDGVFLTENDLLDDSDSDNELQNNAYDDYYNALQNIPKQRNAVERDLDYINNENQIDDNENSYASSTFLSDFQKPINSSLQAQRDDPVSYISLSSIRNQRNAQLRNQIPGFQQYAQESESDTKEDSVIQFVFSSQTETTETDLDKAANDNDYYTDSEFSPQAAQRRFSNSLHLLDSDAIEPMDDNDSNSSILEDDSSENGVFVSGESSLAPGQVSVLNQETDSSLLTSDNNNNNDDSQEIINIKPEEIGIWLS